MSFEIDRRALIRTGAYGLGALALGSGPAAVAQLLGARGFTHGVASGEPSADSILLWTRYVPAGDGAVRLAVELSETPDFARIVAGGAETTGSFRDWTAKITLAGLRAGQSYHYRFVAPDGTRSPIGRTRTLPEGPTERFGIGVFSCANLPYGYFNAYGHAAARDDLDLVVHLGDYYYEYGPGVYPSEAEAIASRMPEPHAEAIRLADYRLRHASYRTDPDLQALHARHPMILSWDDHETANDSWEGGAQNHGADEGDWSARKAAAIQAYREWLPVSDAPYGAYQIGDLATYVRTESRLIARTRQPDLAPLFKEADPIAALRAFRDGAWIDPAATMFGTAQEAWFADALKASVRAGTRWQVVGNGTIMGNTRMPAQARDWVPADAAPYVQSFIKVALAAATVGMPLNYDAWGGYPAARSRFLKAALEADANLVVVAGDSHNAWAYDLSQDGTPAGVEFDGQSVSSPGYENAVGKTDPHVVDRAMVETNPELKWCSTSGRGYFSVALTPETATSEWTFMDTVAARSARVGRTHRMRVRHGARRLEPA